MELRHLRYFVEVAEQKHFGRAAQALFVSQPTLSQQVQMLENELGVELFNRSKRNVERRVELTEAGAEFLIEARKILQMSQKAIEQARKTGLHKQVVRLGVYKIALRERVVEILELLTTHFPDVQVKLTEYPTSNAVQDALLHDDIDLGLIIPPIKHPELSEKRFKKAFLCVMMHKNHSLSKQEVLTLPSLKDAKWVELSQSVHPFYDEIEKACRAAGFSRKANIVQEVSSLELVASLVNVGIGIAFVSSLFDLSREPNIVLKSLVTDPENPDSHLEINNAMAYLTGKSTPLIQALIGFF